MVSVLTDPLLPRLGPPSAQPVLAERSCGGRSGRQSIVSYCIRWATLRTLRMIPFGSFTRNRRTRYTNQDFFAMCMRKPEYEDSLNAVWSVRPEEFRGQLLTQHSGVP